MIESPAGTGVAFSSSADGDLRHDRAQRDRFSAENRIPPDWASVEQVHGDEVVEVSTPGEHGPADALFTARRGLPVAIFTADCAGVVLLARGAVGAAHAGWRGALAGVVGRLSGAMTAAGFPPVQAAVGPLIGPCCFEVGPEVAEQFGDFVATTTWGTTSVDLRSTIVAQIPGVAVAPFRSCTYHDQQWWSHRRQATAARMAAVGWLR
ncbi:MAG: polyphenol oxidase family protein [Actinomycetota bacterium]